MSDAEHKTLAVIGAGYLQKPLVQEARSMGLRTICFAWDEGAVCKDIADVFFPISIVDKESILDICRQEHIDGVCTIASDVAAPTVAYIAGNMGLNGNSYPSAVQANNKYMMRNAFAAAGIPCPRYISVSSVGECSNIDMRYPLIVKPADRSGSLGVAKVQSSAELDQAVAKAIDFSFCRRAMVEEFIQGREISVEFISYHGKHYPLQITDKVTTEAPHFVELEHHQPSTLSNEQFSLIYALTGRALDALGLTDGASHSEYRITDNGGVYVMEIGGRMGGDFIGSDLVKLSTGYNFVRGVIEVALDAFNEPEKTLDMHSGVYFLCKETEYLKPIVMNWRGNPAFVCGEITDDELRNVTCSADRSGYVVYQSDKKWIPGDE